MDEWRCILLPLQEKRRQIHKSKNIAKAQQELKEKGQKKGTVNKEFHQYSCSACLPLVIGCPTIVKSRSDLEVLLACYPSSQSKFPCF